MYLFDPASGYLTLGYKEELSERFDKLKGKRTPGADREQDRVWMAVICGRAGTFI